MNNLKVSENTTITLDLRMFLGIVIATASFVMFCNSIWFKVDQKAYADQVSYKFTEQKLEIKDVEWKLDLILQRLNIGYNKKDLPSHRENILTGDN